MRRLEEIQEILRQKKPILRKRFGVLEIGIFGSFVSGEEKDTSDLDILVELEEPVGLIKFVGLQNYLSDELGEKVDLVTKNALKPRIKKNILSEVVYIHMTGRDCWKYVEDLARYWWPIKNPA